MDYLNCVFQFWEEDKRAHRHSRWLPRAVAMGVLDETGGSVMVL